MDIGFVGAGKVGKALGLYFNKHGLNISGYFSRTEAPATAAAMLTDAKVFTTLQALASSSDIIIIAVPDGALKEIDRKLKSFILEHLMKPDIPIFHVSGAHPSYYLDRLAAVGCDVGCIHPLLSFGTPDSSASQLEQAWFTIEGTQKAVSAAQSILDQTGGKYSLINAENKPLYHAGACVVSNFLVTLLESGIRYFEAAGMTQVDILPAIKPLINTTLYNIEEKGTINALTGPIVRGDFNTVSVHLQALAENLPSELEFYKTAALKTVGMLENKRLTCAQAEDFHKILEDKTYVK